MKKLLNLLLFVLAVCTSCEKEKTQTDENTPTDKGISFTYSNADFEDEDIISLFAASSSDNAYAKNVIYSLSGDKFTSSNAITYPSDKSSLQFHALYPSLGELLGEFKIDTDQTSEQSLKFNNLQVASVSSEESTPELSFESKVVSFEINNSVSELKNLSIAMKNSVLYDVVGDHYEGIGEVENITPCHVSDNKYMAVVAPQELLQGTTIITAELGGDSFWWSVENNVTIPASAKCIIDIVMDDDEPAIEKMVIEEADGTSKEVALISDNSKPKIPINIEVTSVLSTTAIVDVEVMPEVGTYFLYSMPELYITEDYAGDLRAAAEGILAFWTYYGVPLTVDNKFVFNKSITDFDMAKQTEDFSMDTDYVIFAFGVDVSDNSITSDIYAVDIHTGVMTDEDKANYSAWLGDWRVTSSSTYGGSEPVSFDVNITADLEMQSYYVTGWDLSIMKDKAIKVSYDVHLHTLNFPAENFMGKVDNTEELIVMRCFADLGHEEPSHITGVFSSMTGEIAEDHNSAVVSGYKGVISTTGAEFQISHVATTGVANYGLTDELMRFFPADEQGTPVDYPKGPYTMERISSSAPQKAMLNHEALHKFASMK